MSDYGENLIFPKPRQKDFPAVGGPTPQVLAGLDIFGCVLFWGLGIPKP